MPDKTINLTDEALKKYNKWGHRKSEYTSKAILEYNPDSRDKTQYITREEYEYLLNRVKALEERSK
jgi:hypothetical protein